MLDRQFRSQLLPLFRGFGDQSRGLSTTPAASRRVDLHGENAENHNAPV